MISKEISKLRKYLFVYEAKYLFVKNSNINVCKYLGLVIL